MAISASWEGAAEGEYLLYRHNVLLRFLRLVNGGDNLEEAEQMEHFFSKKLSGIWNGFWMNMSAGDRA